jgi:hypothetical protein
MFKIDFFDPAQKPDLWEKQVWMSPWTKVVLLNKIILDEKKYNITVPGL